MSISTKKVRKDILGGRVDQDILGIISTFVLENVFDQASTDVGTLTDLAVFPLY